MKFSVRLILLLSVFILSAEKALPQQQKGGGSQEKSHMQKQDGTRDQERSYQQQQQQQQKKKKKLENSQGNSHLQQLGGARVQEKDFQRVDSLASIAQPKAALALINTLHKRAKAAHQTPMLIKSVMYRMMFQNYLNEHTINQLVGDLKQEISVARQSEKSVLQSLLAQTYWDYYQQNSYRIMGRTTILGATDNSDVETWSMAKLTDQTIKVFLASLSEKELLQKTQTGMLNRVLNGDTATRFLRPTLYDLLAHRALDVFMNPRIDLAAFSTDDYAISNNPLCFAGYKTFSTTKLPVKDSVGFYQGAISVFQDLLKFHAQTQNDAALADANLKRLKFVYERNTSAEKEALYEKALLGMEKESSKTVVYADVLYELAAFYKLQSNSSSTSKVPLSEVLKVANKAVAAYPGSTGAINALKLIKEIQSRAINVYIKEYNLPEKPIQVVYSYKNVDTVYAQLYRVPAVFSGGNVYFSRKEDYAAFLKRSRPVKSWATKLPVQTDYRNHNLYDQIDGMPHGSYVLILRSNKDTTLLNPGYQYVGFRVTGMAVMTGKIKDGNQYFVTDAENGNPLPEVVINEYSRLSNAMVSPVVTAKKSAVKSTITEIAAPLNTLKTNHEGLAIATTAEIARALISKGADSLYMDVYNYQLGNFYQRKEVVLFTDRPIYRPGQTVFYKGIYLKITESDQTILGGQALEVSFKDVNRKQLASTPVSTNDYGTFQGSFEIPAGRLNGNMEISTQYGNIIVAVEEYKRPTFEVFFDQQQIYKLNDSVQVKGKAVTFAGYPVAGAKFNYTVNRYMLPNRNHPYPRIADKQVAYGTGETMAGGDFKIPFFTEGTKDSSDSYSFNIKIEITDINGETRSNTHVVNLGSNARKLAIAMPDKLFLDAVTDTLSLTVTNENGEQIKTNLQVEWKALKAPGRLTNRSPFFLKPERYSLSKAAYFKLFPFEEYNGDGDPQNWEVKSTVAKDSMAVKGVNGTLKINPSMLQQGYYKVLFTGLNSSGDTLSAEKTIRVYAGKPTTIQSMNEWLVLEKSSIERSESAVFRIASASPKGKAWYIVYYKGKLIERVALQTSPKQQVVKIKPAPGFVGEFAVQFTLVENGKIYNELKTIPIIDSDKELDVKFLTFRDKLQPGEKESWKIKISNRAGKNQMAEMVATLYDASLDNLKKMQWDKLQPTVFNYTGYTFKYNLNIQHGGTGFWFLRNQDNYYSFVNRSYEQLSLLETEYGGDVVSVYPLYLQQLENKRMKILSDQAIKRLSELHDSKILYGVVTDNTGFAIQGATVKAGNLSVLTDQYGIYQINAEVGEELAVILIGFTKTTALITGIKRMDIVMGADRTALNEVVVGYGIPGASDKVLIRGKSSLSYDLQSRVPGMNIVQDTKVYDFLSVETYDPKSGMMIINGKPVQTRNNIVARTNFSETAFFYPQLHTNEAGEINIDFTVPQSVTRYKMMGFVHTKDMKVATVGRELVTQKQLAIAVNAPRFFREGDTIRLTAKLNNLSGKLLDGAAVLELKDALSGKALGLLGDKEKAAKHFKVADKGNEVLSWTLIIPSGISALTYKATAQAGDYSDGEEMTVPVLPNSTLVTETMSLNVRGNSSKTFSFDHLLQSGASKTLRNQCLTVEFTSNPIWYAVQALPYLMEYSDECSEQTLNRFYANSFATGIINSAPKIKKVFEQWKQSDGGASLLSNLEKNPQLKTALLQETPWVREADSESERKKRLGVLFDLNRMAYESKNSFEKLEKMQNGNGSFSWFTGMREDRYITQYIMLGLAQLKHLNLIDEKVILPFSKPVEDVMNKTVVYLDKALKQDFQKDTSKFRTAQNSAIKNNMGYLPLHYLYARSYLHQKSSDPEFNTAHAFYLKKIVNSWKTMDIYQQGQAALILHRSGNTKEALNIISLLKDRAQQSDEMGMYWPDNHAGWWWYQNPLETQALLIEAFDEVAGDAKSVEEMKIWLLKNKQTNDWKTTKATAAACYALLRKGYDLPGESAAPEITISGIGKMETDLRDKEAGTGYQKITIPGNKVQPAMGKVTLKNPNQTITWGAVYWQYFEQLDKIKSTVIGANTSAAGINIKKQLFLEEQTGKGKVIKQITQETVLRAGDLVKVRIEINADRNMEYVHLKDMRAAGFEPINSISRYKYQDGLGYYETTKDASSNFFISYLPKGVYVFEYDLRVAHAGSFSNGITTIQCMYAPEFTTRSAGERVTVKP